MCFVWTALGDNAHSDNGTHEGLQIGAQERHLHCPTSSGSIELPRASGQRPVTVLGNLSGTRPIHVRPSVYLILAGLRAVLQGELPSLVATYARPFNGPYHWFQVLISVDEIKGIRHAILMHVDVSAMQRDALTGLPNRTHRREQSKVSQR